MRPCSRRCMAGLTALCVFDVPARGAAVDPALVDGGRLAAGPAADVRVHLLRRQQRRAACSSRARRCSGRSRAASPRPDDPARRACRRRARRRRAGQDPDARVRPGVALALLVALWRTGRGRPSREGSGRRRGRGCRAARALRPARATLWDRPLFDRVGEVASTPSVAGARLPRLRGQLSYLWQEYLPRLPFMQDLFPGFAPWRSGSAGSSGASVGWTTATRTGCTWVPWCSPRRSRAAPSPSYGGGAPRFTLVREKLRSTCSVCSACS